MTGPADWPDIEALLDAALDLPAAERVAFLDAAARSNAAAAREAKRLLGLHPLATQFLERPATEIAEPLIAADAAHDDAVPDCIGPYRVLRTIGYGGMGAVYLGERDDPHLLAAIKVVAGGFVGSDRLRRFIDERQILASLDHPGIARLLDGGVTADGAPWFAMEYVDGTPIDRYCAEHAPAVDARLELFLQVCDAVQYAHGNLVVHRDLKPSNILVTADGRVKLLDFGIAKLIAPEGSTAAALTRTGSIPMTPAYASPEQIRGEAVSTAGDVYALGVLLYELLTGTHPHLHDDIPQHDLARRITETAPAPPSSRVDARMQRRLRGDLDTLVAMAMRIEPARRYATAEQFATDIRRHLDGRPIIARGDTWRYRTGKFVARNRTLTSAAVLLLLLAAAYVVTLTVQSRRLAAEAARTEQLVRFLSTTFASAPQRGMEPAQAGIVDEGARRVATELAGEPEIQAVLMAGLGDVYSSLGRYDDAVEQLAAAYAIQRRAGRIDDRTAATAQALARSLHYDGRHADALRLLDEVLTIWRSLHGDASWQVGEALAAIGDVLHTRGELGAAETHLRTAGDVLLRANGGADGIALAQARRDLANVLRDRGAFAEAELLYRWSLDYLVRTYGAGDAVAALTRNDFARLLIETDRHAEADDMLRENMDVYAALYPDGRHAMVGISLRNLGVLRLREGRAAEAADALEQSIATLDDVLPEWHFAIARTRRHLAAAMLALGDSGRAAREAQLTIATLEQNQLTGHRAYADAVRTLNDATRR
jgi:eukaryotic-like serine/threonine-protein kinase